MSVLSYQTIIETSIGEYKEKGSKFIAIAFPLNSVSIFMDKLEEVKVLYPKARHYCWAYKMDYDGTNRRLNDDGEPSGTAGKPIMGQLDSFNITNVGIIVVRYFGGTKLGVTGLIQAYKTSSESALLSNTIIEKQVETAIKLRYDDQLYAKIQIIIGTVKPLVSDIEYIDLNNILFKVSLQNKEQLTKKINEILTGYKNEHYENDYDNWKITEMPL
jgi:uncharacterized YigZ family protein